MTNYDSKNDTLEHIESVQENIKLVLLNLQHRSINHDKSKLESPEKEVFDEFTPKLKNSTYMSDEYHSFLEEMKVGLRHHYSKNDHHPEHYTNGIDGMSLLSLIEMLCDWQSATKRHADGDLLKSIQQNKKRFGYNDWFEQILINTARELKFIP